MKYTLLKMAVIALKVIYLPIRLLPLQNKIAIISRQGDKPSLDIDLLSKGMMKYYPEFKLVVMTKRIIPTFSGCVSYVFHMLRQIYHIATSRVIVVDGYCIAICLLKHKKETTVIQMWHALAAIKKFGLQSIDTPSGTNRRLADIMHMHENYDYVFCSSEETGEFFSKGFNVEKNKIRLLGLPRIDSLVEEDKNTTADIEGIYGSKSEKKTALYVPTFRKGEVIDIRAIAEYIDFNTTRLIVKLHPLDKTVVPDDIKRFVNVDDKFSTYDLLHYADIIITDYSSLGVEASLLMKPMFFYLYDYDKYKEDPGINIDLFEEMGKYATKEAAILGELLYEEYDYSRLEKFRNKYIEADCSNCTKQICDFIAGLMKRN